MDKGEKKGSEMRVIAGRPGTTLVQTLEGFEIEEDGKREEEIEKGGGGE